MNRTRDVSLESLNVNEKNDQTIQLANKLSSNYDLSAHLTISLDDIYDNISLYEYSEHDGKSTRRLTWEEWYLKKKIEALKNENMLREKMSQKMQKHSNRFRNFNEEEKKQKILEWLERKREEKEQCEIKLEKLQQEAQLKKEKKEQAKQKGEAKYQEWLLNLKKKELDEKERQLEEARQEKLKREQEKQKRRENLKHLLEQNRKHGVEKVRPISARKGQAIVNGKLCAFYDWSTSPQPTFINKNEWKF